MRVYSIHDSKGAVYSRPFYEHTDATAERVFADACVDEETPIGRHPSDYTLNYVGEWDEFIGKLSGAEPRAICNGSKFAAMEVK